MKYEKMLASRYIRSQKRQSTFTVISIAIAVAILTMIFVLHGVMINCIRNTVYKSAPYHLVIHDLTDFQAKNLWYTKCVGSVKTEHEEDGTFSAMILFDKDIGYRDAWLEDAAKRIGATEQYEQGQYEWNDMLMTIDTVDDEGHLNRIRIFVFFFIFAVFFAVALRLVVDTAFEISSKERERQYGVLQSIGATPGQIVNIITIEGMRQCITAIPAGIISGIVFARIMYGAVLSAGLLDYIRGTTGEEPELGFSVDPLMLLVSAAVGAAWVFLSAYGVGMRVIKKSPIEAIKSRPNDVRKIRKHTLSGLIFGISGNIASRNTRRQKKRFIITVLSLTISITLFSLFTELTENIERNINQTINDYSYDCDFIAANYSYNFKGNSYEETIKELEDSRLFKDTEVCIIEMNHFKNQEFRTAAVTCYVNKAYYDHMFGENAPVSYEELARSGDYIINQSWIGLNESTAEIPESGTYTVITERRTIPDGLDTDNMSLRDVVSSLIKETPELRINVAGKAEAKEKVLAQFGGLLIGTLETYNEIRDEYYGSIAEDANCFCTCLSENKYNEKTHKEITDWFEAHSETVCLEYDLLKEKIDIHNVMAALRTGGLIVNLLLAVTAIVNMMNIISTGIANRKSEMASLQCMGMTDGQLKFMTAIECLQYSVLSAVFSIILSVLLITGTEKFWTVMTGALTDRTQTVMTDMICSVPYFRIVISTAAAFVIGCITSFVMLKVQNSESLAEQIRTE